MWGWKKFSNFRNRESVLGDLIRENGSDFAGNWLKWECQDALSLFTGACFLPLHTQNFSSFNCLPSIPALYSQIPFHAITTVTPISGSSTSIPYFNLRPLFFLGHKRFHSIQNPIVLSQFSSSQNHEIEIHWLVSFSVNINDTELVNSLSILSMFIFKSWIEFVIIYLITYFVVFYLQ